MIDWDRQIEEDLAWREAELASLKVQAAQSSKGSVRHDALLRAMWTLLYAHYEGFCKFMWDLYLDELQTTGIKRSDCKDVIARLSLQGEFNQLKGNLSPASIWEFCSSRFTSLMGEPLGFKVRLETRSNLWPGLLKENSSAVGLPSQTVDEHSAKLRALVSRRNEIAHGQKMVVNDLDEYQEYEHAAFMVMHELALGVVDCLERRTYLR